MNQENLSIRYATKDDAKILASIEAAGFPKEEAAPEDIIRERIGVFSNHFWLLEKDGKTISFINGYCTDIKDLADEMYEHSEYHDENGDWQMIFSVCTHPDFQRKGYAGYLMNHVIDECKKQGRKGLVLTCKDEKIHFYKSFGFELEGVSESTHGGVVWNQMRLTF